MIPFFKIENGVLTCQIVAFKIRKKLPVQWKSDNQFWVEMSSDTELDISDKICLGLKPGKLWQTNEDQWLFLYQTDAKIY